MEATLTVELLAKIDGLTNSLEAAQTKLQKFGEAAKDIGAKMTASLTLPILAFGGAAVKAFGDIQSLKNGLTAVTGSAKETNIQFSRLTQLAKLPGLGLKEVTEGSINLQVIGFTAEKAEKSIKAFGNAVATVGKGRAEFERATYGLAQLANTDFPLGEDLNIIKDAIPQVTPLLKEAFGSARSDELKELGVTSAQVVDAIVNGLDKLPPVTGGVNAAFENMKDGIFSNLSRVGDIINQNLDISALADRVVNSLTKITDLFETLSPAVQKAVLIIAGLTAALGPLLYIIGLMTTSVIPTLVSGMAVLSGAITAVTLPVAAIAIAIGAAVYLIIKYWDDIVAYFTTGEGKSVFDELLNAFDAAIQFIKDAWRDFVKLLKDFWENWGDDIIRIAKFYFGIISTYFKTVFKVIGSIFQAGSAILSGEWQKAGDILLDMTKNIWNGIISIITNVVTAGGKLIAKFFEFIGLENFGKKFETLNTAIATFLKDKLTFDVKATVRAADGSSVVASDEEGTIIKKTQSKAVAALSEQAKAAVDIYKELQKALAKIGTDTTIEGMAKRTENIARAYRSAKDAMIDAGFAENSKEVRDLTAKMLLYSQSLDVVIDKVKNKDFSLTPKLDLTPIEFDKKAIEFQQKIIDFGQTITTTLQSAMTEGLSGIGEAIGGALASGAGILEAVGTSMLGTLGGLLVQLGKIAIQTGIGLLAIKKAFESLNPVVAIAAGVALVAFGSLIKGSLSKLGGGTDSAPTAKGPSIKAFAKGGIIYGPTMALMGEYAGASSNPEVVAPLNKLKDLIGGGQPTVVNASVGISMRELVVKIRQEEKLMGRMG